MEHELVHSARLLAVPAQVPGHLLPPGLLQESLQRAPLPTELLMPEMVLPQAVASAPAADPSE